MRSLRILLCLLALLLLPAAGEAEKPPRNGVSGELTVVTDDNYPPYAFRDGDGALKGYLVDLWALWEKRTGRPVHLIGTNWEAAQRLMAAGEADVIDTVFETPERDRVLDFTRAYADIRVPILVHKSIGGIDGPGALRGFLVGVKAGDACIDRLRADGIDTFRTFDSYAGLVEAARTEHIKILCLDEPPANYLLYKAGIDRSFYQAFLLYTGQFHRAVHKGDIATLRLVELGFERIGPAELKQAQDKWLGERLRMPASVRYISYGLLAALVAGGVLAIWVFTLRREVRRRIAELGQERNRLHTLIETIPDMVWLKTPDGVFLTCNHEFEKLYGVPEADIVGKTDFDFVDPLQAQFFRQHDRAAIAAGKPTTNQEWVTYAADGRTALLQTIKTPMRDDSGALVGVLGIARDITRMHQVEQELRQSEALLLQSQRLASVGHFVFDYASQTLRTSKVLDGILGIADIRPSGLDDLLARVHPDYRGDVMGRLADVRRTGGSLEREFPVLLEPPCNDGGATAPAATAETRWVKMSAEILFAADGTPSSLFGTVQDISEARKSAAEIQQLAFYDPLTRLPNRRLLLERLSRATSVSERSGCHIGLIFIDIDNFKVLNDTRGHRVGDLLLEEVGRRLNACVRTGDTVARFGGDEFVVMIEGLSDRVEQAVVQADVVAEKILHQLSMPYLLEGQSHHSGASLGLTLFNGTGTSNDDLLRQADLAMYQAKAAGRNTRRFFDPGMQRSLTAQTLLEEQLRDAVAGRGFVLYYQPQISRDGGIVGAEGLIRWPHPTRGLLAPAEFIAAAEMSDLILSIGGEVTRMACRQLALWGERDETRHLTLSINVSARQFRHPSFVREIREALSSSGAEPAKLKLELTESLLLQDIEDCAQKMLALRALGLHLSLDDFGTGYSSLSYLKRLPFSQLKIDRSFVRDILTDPNDAAIARTIILLARTFGLTVIAEGVEEEGQWRLLLAEGCDEGQGFLFGQPLPEPDFLTLVADWRTGAPVPVDAGPGLVDD